jgi:cortexillin 1/2
LRDAVDPKLISSISAEDFVDKNLKLILGFLWTLFRKYRISVIKTNGKSSEEGLLLWVKNMTEGYKNVNVESYKNSFKDGK